MRVLHAWKAGRLVRTIMGCAGCVHVDTRFSFLDTDPGLVLPTYACVCMFLCACACACASECICVLVSLWQCRPWPHDACVTARALALMRVCVCARMCKGMCLQMHVCVPFRDAGPGGLDKLKQHAWFAPMDWDALAQLRCEGGQAGGGAAWVVQHSALCRGGAAARLCAARQGLAGYHQTSVASI